MVFCRHLIIVNLISVFMISAVPFPFSSYGVLSPQSAPLATHSTSVPSCVRVMDMADVSLDSVRTPVVVPGLRPRN